MRWISLACCVLYSPLALAIQAGSPATQARQAPGALVHDGYRLRGVAAGGALTAAPAAAPAATACAALPAAPSPSAGELAVVPLVKERFFNKFFQGGGRLYRLVTQQQGEPRAIAIHSGTWTLPRLVQALSGQPDVLQRQGNAYLLRVPLLLEHGAGLLLREGDTLRLSRDRGAFIISMGTLHAYKARLEAWDEARGKPSEVADDGGSFSPFIVGWSGSRTLISQSVLGGLGFAENLAQGLTLASGPVGLAGYTMPPSGTVSIQDSRFEGMYSAVHASGIPDLRLCRNQFIDSRLHAIHLEEGSSGVMERNKITATRGAYGVYFNKGVHDVTLLQNDISENQRSGIAVSESRNIVLRDNEVRQNFDAVFVQDSDQIDLRGNRILDNQRHGLSLRNVGQVRLHGDQIGPNRGVGLLAMPASSRDGMGRSATAARQPGAEVPAASQAAVSDRGRGGGAAAVTLASFTPGALPSGATSTPGVPPGPSMPVTATLPTSTGKDSKEAKAEAAPTPRSEPRTSSAATSALPDSGGGGERAPRGSGKGAETRSPSEQDWVQWRPSVQKIEMRGVMLEGNHSSAMVIEKPYTVLLDGVTVMYPGVRRRPVFRGVLNYFESDILKRLQRQEALLIEPGAVTGPSPSRRKEK